MQESWATERLYDGWQQRFRVTREIARETSGFQEIVIVETAWHGRVMLLDGIVQITERDEFVYQEMLAHVPILAHGRCRNVLIIGAGDGGVLKRVLQHRGVERVVMVEIDGEVVRLARAHLPEIGGAAWDDVRTQIVIGDGIDYVRRSGEAAFDVVIVDSTDPVGAGEALFSEAFYRDVARVLAPDGLVVNQCGVPFMQAEELRETSLLRARVFPYVGVYLAAVPTYVGGFMALGIASRRAAFTPGMPGEIRDRAAASGMLGRTEYWSPQIHTASFELPPYIARHLPGQAD